MTRFWPDGRVRVGGREYPGIVQSACFESGELTCLSCHRMHQDAADPRTVEEWADDQLDIGMRTDEACVGCGCCERACIRYPQPGQGDFTPKLAGVDSARHPARLEVDPTPHSAACARQSNREGVTLPRDGHAQRSGDR